MPVKVTEKKVETGEGIERNTDIAEDYRAKAWEVRQRSTLYGLPLSLTTFF